MPVTTGGVLGHTSERRQGVKFPYVGWDRSNLRNCDFPKWLSSFQTSSFGWFHQWDCGRTPI